MTVQNKLKVAVIGYGHLGKWHCQKVEQTGKADLYAIVEANEAAHAEIAQTYPQAKVVSNIQKVINDIDAALIVTPTSIHFPMLQILLKHDKNIFCEKPICANENELTELIKLMKSSKKVLQVGHSERFHEAWEILNKVPDLFQAPSLMRLERLSPYHSRSKDVDVVSDLMIHDIDLLLYLLKERPSKVQAVGSKTKSDHLDQAIVSFSFPGGHHAVVTAHRDYVLADRNFEITNKFGTIYIDLVKNKIVSNFNLETGAEGQFEINYTKRDHLFLEQDSFYESILNGQENKCTFEEGIEACKLSLQIINLVHAGNS